MRKPYLDNLRWATVVLVMVYHVCYLFNGVGVLGGIPGAHSLPLGDALATIVYPWVMVLLFVVAANRAGLCLPRHLCYFHQHNFGFALIAELVAPGAGAAAYNCGAGGGNVFFAVV